MLWLSIRCKAVYAAVSVNNGVQSLNEIKANLEFIESFKEVFICYDNEPKAREAARKVADLIAGKARIVILPDEYKDANEMLQAGKGAEFSRAFWWLRPTPHRGLSIYQIRSQVLVQGNRSLCTHPWQGLNKSLLV